MKVSIVLGSISDKKISDEIVSVLKKFGIDYELEVISAHRTPERAYEFANTAIERGVGVIISIAGKAAHLGGVIAANTTLPVIGVPVKSSTLDGLDALLSTVQMPSGVPVASVAIDGGKNAALLAIEILAVSDENLRAKLVEHKNKLKEDVKKMNEELLKEE
ncbi:5-(carboxyamino)imidazole ribonucleotide mutase [Anaerosphaera multitolerans]|uniref:N5-carboxyaminoimidazole ribonucleotide mutase n=1 Tax=Anaerosphaera multitolerans TaxID=2487351 RepID=A0A437S808_9FIRM|nr:5-(carboxyamino)imidazole ribonucleotide mutase [Anaerosphaera multitolerans]RVU55206.1 5-(carboxyamino)imidazole ribonucleotide mutase [Anaerosphaera multitolerans]